ncbi:MAG: hypothetical protein V2A73_03685, partial [Pseudomonadota bacterium]
LQVLSPVLLAALTWVAAKVAQLINAKVRGETVRNILLRLEDATVAAVRDVYQSVVEEIKSASVDGKLTAEERLRVKARAIATVRAHLGMKGLAELATVLGLDDGAVQQMISTRVEATVHDLKRARMTNGVHSPAGDAIPFAA